jgi:hypothetical protein
MPYQVVARVPMDGLREHLNQTADHRQPRLGSTRISPISPGTLTGRERWTYAGCRAP